MVVFLRDFEHLKFILLVKSFSLLVFDVLDSFCCSVKKNGSLLNLKAFRSLFDNFQMTKKKVKCFIQEFRTLVLARMDLYSVLLAKLIAL